MPIVDVDNSTALSDRELLREYATAGSNKDLAEIVRRHVDLVYSCASRQVRDSALAEDVTQAVFLILQKKFRNTGQSHKAVLLTGWLVNTACFASRDALRQQARRIKHERRAAAMRPVATLPEVDDEAAELHRHVDEAIARLPTKDRDVIVLRFVQARSFNEVSAALGVSVDAAEKRVSRALEKLRTMLTAKGVTVPAAGLAAALLSLEASKAPASLMTAGASTSAQSIAGAVLKHWAGITSMKAAVVVFALVLVATFVGFIAMRSGPSRTPMVATPPAVQVAAAPVAPVLAKPVEGNGSMDVLVVDDDGKPLAGVTLRTRNTRNRKSSTLTTDETGHCTVAALAPGDQDLAVNFDLPGHVPAHAWWPSNNVRGGLPPTYKLTLPKAAVVSGVVLDEAGKPIAGAQVELPLSLDVRDGYQLLSLAPGIVATDADGRWRCENAPAKWPMKPVVRVSHDEYLSPANEWDAVDENALHAGTLITKMRSGITINGTVTDAEGRPIAGAIIGKGDNQWNPKPDYEEFTTDSAGRFTIPRVPPDESPLFLTTRAKGYGPELRKLIPKTQGDTPIQIKLDVGRSVRGTVTDKSGKPLVGIYIEAYHWGPESQSGLRPTTLALKIRSDAKGEFHFDDCPLDSFDVRAYAEGLTEVTAEFSSTTDIQKFILSSKMKVHGSVTDAETGQKVAKFQVVIGTPDGSTKATMRWRDSDARDLGDGWYEISPELWGHPDCAIRIVAEGYRPASSRLIKAGESDVAIDFKLQKDSGVGGTIVGSDGKPANDVIAVVASVGSQPPTIQDGRVERNSRSAAVIRSIGIDGKFSFPTRDEPFDVIFVSDAGYLRLPGSALASTSATQPAQFKLLPWAVVEGSVIQHGKPLAGATMQLSFGDGFQVQEKRQPVYIEYATKPTDATGHFRFERVIPEPCTLLAMRRESDQVSRRILSLPTERIIPQPGETTTIRLGRLGRPILGKFVAPQGDTTIDLAVSSLSAGLGAMPENLPVPKDWDTLPDEQQSKWVEDFRVAPAGIAYIALHQHDKLASIELEVKSDGSFQADDVPPGRYQLYVNVNGPAIQTSPNTKTIPHVAGLQRYLTIPGPPNTAIKEPFDLGPLEIKPDKPTTQPADSR